MSSIRAEAVVKKQGERGGGGGASTGTEYFKTFASPLLPVDTRNLDCGISNSACPCLVSVMFLGLPNASFMPMHAYMAEGLFHYIFSIVVFYTVCFPNKIK